MPAFVVQKKGYTQEWKTKIAKAGNLGKEAIRCATVENV